MLILTRRIGETLVIGENMDITITILQVNGNQVRIGINAPKDVPVHREEIAERIINERITDGFKPNLKEIPEDDEFKHIIVENDSFIANDKIYG